MGRYKDLIIEIRKRELDNYLKKVSETKINNEVIYNPSIPKDYIDFLQEIGGGSIGRMYYSIYRGLNEPDEIYDPISAQKLEGVLLFGDDFAGCCTGFMKNEDWKLVEIDDFHNVDYLNKNFEEFIREKFIKYFVIYDNKNSK